MNRVAVLWVCLALVVTAEARRGGGGGFKGGFSWGKGSSTGSKGTSTGSKTSSNTRGSSSGGTHSQPGNYPRQPQIPNQNPPPYPGTGGGYPGSYPGSYPGRGGVGGNPNQGSFGGAGSYPGRASNPGAGSYPNSYPGRSGGYGNPYPQGGSYPGYPVRGASYPGSSSFGGAAGVGGYPGAAQYPYWNPNNKIISPRYGGNYGYGGYGSYGAGGSPFAHSVQNMGMGPSLQSKGFGKQAVMAAGVGAMAGMALGYGLGSFPRPHFVFHSPQEEYYYNHYMYSRYGTRPSDRNTNPGSPGNGPGVTGLSPANSETKDAYDIIQNPPPQSYDHYMNSCMKRTDLLREEQGRNKRAAENPLDTSDGEMVIDGIDPNGPQGADPVLKPEAEASENVTGSENNGEGIQTSNTTRTLPLPEKLTAGTDAPLDNTGKMNEDDDEATVSIMEIGYPALIEQLKARRCIELYMVYAERHAERQVADNRSGGEQLMPGFRMLRLLLSSTVSLLISSLLLH